MALCDTMPCLGSRFASCVGDAKLENDRVGDVSKPAPLRGRGVRLKPEMDERGKVGGKEAVGRVLKRLQTDRLNFIKRVMKMYWKKITQRKGTQCSKWRELDAPKWKGNLMPELKNNWQLDARK
ncbi:hypothetical protein B0H13DRAFT_1850898 [Mycena leptocephala]|nr:hypothetical protein B0H13DRAFT_1850898 [Mycena leptocephala]